MLTIEIFLMGILEAVSTAICGDVRKTSERVIYRDGNGMPQPGNSKSHPTGITHRKHPEVRDEAF